MCRVGAVTPLVPNRATRALRALAAKAIACLCRLSLTLTQAVRMGLRAMALGTARALQGLRVQSQTFAFPLIVWMECAARPHALNPADIAIAMGFARFSTMALPLKVNVRMGPYASEINVEYRLACLVPTHPYAKVGTALMGSVVRATARAGAARVLSIKRMERVHLSPLAHHQLKIRLVQAVIAMGLTLVPL